MIFLTQIDFETAIKAENLTTIINSNTGMLDAAVLAAVQEIQSYLKSKYDVATIFAATGEDRNAQIMMYTIDITLYHIHQRVAPRQVPEARIVRYQQAIDWLKLVMRGSIIPDLPLIPTDDVNATIQYGSRTPFNYE